MSYNGSTFHLAWAKSLVTNMAAGKAAKRSGCYNSQDYNPYWEELNRRPHDNQPVIPKKKNEPEPPKDELGEDILYREFHERRENDHRNDKYKPREELKKEFKRDDRGPQDFYQQRFESRGSDHRDDRNAQNRHQETRPISSYAKLGGHRPNPYHKNNRCDRNSQDRRESTRQDEHSNHQSYRHFPYSKRDRSDTRHSYPSRRSSRDFESHNPRDQKSDYSDGQDYIHDLIQFVHDRNHDETHQLERSRRLSHDEKRPSHGDRISSHDDRRSSHDGRKSSCDKKEATRPSSRLSGWNVKIHAEDSKSGRSSNSHSNAENDPSEADGFPSYATQKSNHDSCQSTSVVKSSLHSSQSISAITESTDLSPIKVPQSNIDNSIVAESAKLLPASSQSSSAINESTDLLPVKAHQNNVDNSIVVESAKLLPSSSQANCAITESTDLLHIKAHRSNVDNSIIAELTKSLPATTNVNNPMPTSNLTKSNDLLSTPIITCSTNISSSTIVSGLSNVSPPLSSIELIDLTETENEQSTNISPSSPKFELIDLSVSVTSTKNDPSIDVSLFSPKVELLDLSVPLISNKNDTSTDFSPASPDVEINDVLGTPTGNKSEPSNVILPSISTDCTHLLSTLTGTETAPSNVMPLLTDTDCDNLLSALTGAEYEQTNNALPSTSTNYTDLLPILNSTERFSNRANSNLETNNGLVADMPSTSREYWSLNTDSSTSSRNVGVPVKENQNSNRKRSIDTSDTIHSCDQNSSVTECHTQKSHPDEVPTKKSMYHSAVPEIVTRENKQSVFATSTECVEKRSNPVTVKSIAPVTFMWNKIHQLENQASKQSYVAAKSSLPKTSDFNQNYQQQDKINKQSAVIAQSSSSTTTGSIQNHRQRSKQNDIYDPKAAAVSISKDVPMKLLKSAYNENIIEKRKSEVDLHTKKINKKLKYSVKKDNDANEVKANKLSILKKDRIKQFKVILKILKSRSTDWTLPQLDDLDPQNFCDVIHHFENPSTGICVFKEVKFFDRSSKANKIHYRSLFGDEFNIQKYFDTFCKFEHTCFANQQSKLNIMTNRDLDVDLLENNGIYVFYRHSYYTFEVKTPYDESKIYKKCLECFVLPKLAELLYDFVHIEYKVPHFNMELMRKYHLALVNEKVLQLFDEVQNGKSTRVAKFHPDFIDIRNLSNAAKELRYHLEKRHRCSPIVSMKFRVANKDFGRDVALTRFEETEDKLPNENSKETFERFFKVFQIVRFDEREIEKGVIKELGEEFSKIEEIACSNAVRQELLITLKNNGLKPDILEPLKQTISKLKVTEKITQQATPLLDIEFGLETFSNLSKAIGGDNIILCSTESLPLSVLKMRQYSKNKPYLENEESLFVTDEILLEMTDDVVNAFSQRLTKLLVIVWKTNVVINTRHAQQIENVLQTLRNVMNNKLKTEKSVVIIADKRNVNLSLSQYQFTIIDENLSLGCQNYVFKSTELVVQELTLTLADLANDAAISNLIKSPKFLQKFLTEKVVVGRELIKPSGFKEKLYDFKLKQRVIIDSKIFQEKIYDVFLIRNINCENFFREYKPPDRIVYLSNSSDIPVNARFVILDSNVIPEDVFNKIKGRNVHLLNYESNNFIWQYTRGSLAALLKYKITDNEAYTSNTVEDILINGPKTVIVSGQSGTGKSVCLYDFAKLASKLYHTKSNPSWIVQVNLNQPLENTYKGCTIETSDQAIHFLADYLHLRNEQKELFIMSAQGRLKLKLMLFIDGYDDVYENVDLMTSLLQHLQDSSIQKMFVASKWHKLEGILGTFLYSLQFGDEEKIQFIDKFSDGRGPKIDVTTKAKLLNTPLHLQMFMELCHSKPEKSLIENYYDLYESYVHLYLPSNQLKKAYKLSAQKMLSKNELEEIGTTIDDVELELPEELSHKTVIEYFVAKWFSERHRSKKKCINNLVERTSSVFLNTYLVEHNKKKEKIPIDHYAEHGHLSFLKAVLKLDDSIKPCLRSLISKGKDNTYEVLKFLLEHYNDTGCYEFIQYSKYVNSNLVKYVNNQVDGQTPLQTAAEYQKIDLACELMLKGADISILDPHFNFIMSMATYATEELANGNTRLGPIAAELLKKSPQATAHLDNMIQFPKVLSYLFSRGHAKLIKELLSVRHENERNQLLETKVDGKSLLDQVNESQSIENKDRLSLIIYLVNTDPNLLQNNIDSILRSACLSGHEETFNYFHPEKTSIDILRKALRSNDEKIIEFLMRDSKRTIDSNGNTALHQAITLGVSHRTINYLLRKVGINDTNNAGETALHLAFKEGASLSTIKFLIDKGASLTATNELGFVPWIHTVNDNFSAMNKESSRYCKVQQRELMTYLMQIKKVEFPDNKSKNLIFDMTKKEILPKLEYFANPDEYNLDYKDGNSRLHAALLNRDEKDWCMFLINHGANVNIENENGKSAFHVALEYGRYDVAKLMLQHGAMIDKTDRNKNTPLDCLTYRPSDLERQKMNEILRLAVKIFENGHNLKTILSVNSSNIDISHFRYLLNCRNEHGRSLLHVAAHMGDPNIIDHLYKLSDACQILYRDFLQIDVNAIDEHGNTPLHLAAMVNAESVEKLLFIGARFRIKNFEGKKPMDLSHCGSPVRELLQAAEDLFKFIEHQNTVEVVRLLKEYPAVQNARDNSGKTPLHLVKNEEMMEYLLTDVNVLDEHQRSPIYYAAERNDLSCAKLLLKAGAIYNFKGFQDGRNETYKLLQKIDEVFEDMHSHKPKFFIDGNPWAFNKELDNIANTFRIARDIVVNVKDNQKNTLLHYAAKYDYVDVTENLLKNGAIFNCRNKYSKTPADFANSSKQLFITINNLFTNLDVNTWSNVDPNVATNCRTSGGFTLLHKAVEKGYYETVKWLVDQGADTKATGTNSVRFQVDKNKYPEMAELLEKN